MANTSTSVAFPLGFVIGFFRNRTLRTAAQQLARCVLRNLTFGLAPLALLALAPSGHAQQDVTIRFLDFRSGKPIEGLNVTITAFDGYGPRTSVSKKTIVFRISRKTDEKGRIIVPLTDALPNHVRIWADLSESVPDFSPLEILKSGLILPYHQKRGKPMPDVSPKPGEIVIVNRRVTGWDRMRQEVP